MAIKTIIFDLDDTLLYDQKSVKTAFEKTCAYASSIKNVDAVQLEDEVRKAARTLYEGYETYDYTVLIGINPFEGLWGTFDDPTPQFQKLKELVQGYRAQSWTNGLAALGMDDATFGAELGERFVAERKKAPFFYMERCYCFISGKDDCRSVQMPIYYTNALPYCIRKCKYCFDLCIAINAYL